MYHFNSPYDPYSQSYAMYTSSTTVPTYALQHTLLSLSDQQSRIRSQREQLATEEEHVRRLRAATIQRMQAQKFRDIMEEAELVEQHFESDEDQIMRDAVMGIFNEARVRRMSEGLPPYSLEFQREIRVREMLDPSPRNPSIQFHIPVQPHFHVRRTTPPQYHVPPAPNAYIDTPIIDELPPHFTHPFPTTQYVPETPSFMNKRGSRRNSVRRESHPTLEFPPKPFVSLSETLLLFNQIHMKLQNELSTVSNVTRSHVPPTAEEQKELPHHMIKLEDILVEVDAVALPTESAEVATARAVRRQLVGEIVTAIDEIEKFIQPGTPALGPVPGTSNVYEDSSDGDENVLIDEDIQRAIRETLARKKDEDVPRRSVTVEDVPDSEY